MRRPTVLVLTAVLSFASSAFAAPPLYRQVMQTPLGAPDRWDYVDFDSSSGRVFVSHGDRVSVVDGRTGAVVGEVMTPGGATHGIAVAAGIGRGYTDDGGAGTVKAFDLKSLAVTGTIPARPDADAIVRDPASGHVFIVDGDSHSLTVIDPATDTVLANVPTGEGLEFATSDGAGKLYVNGVDNRDLLRVDTATNAIDARWPIPDCERPHGLAMDVQSRRLFASCVNGKLVVVNADTGREVASLPIGLGSDAVAFDPVRQRVFSANGKSGTLSIIHEDAPDHYTVLAELPTVKSARTLAVDPKTGRVYLAAADLAPPASSGARPKAVAGSLRLIILDPVE